MAALVLGRERGTRSGQNWAELAEGDGAANFPSPSSVISAKSRVSLGLATCARKDQPAKGVADFRMKEFGDCRGRQWRWALGRRKGVLPAHGVGSSSGTPGPAHSPLTWCCQSRWCGRDPPALSH